MQVYEPLVMAISFGAEPKIIECVNCSQRVAAMRSLQKMKVKWN